MDGKVPVDGLIQTLYHVLLGRIAAEEEIEFFVSRSRLGVSISNIIADISNSGEAKQYALKKTLSSMTVAEASAHALSLNASMLVGVEDVMNTIAQAYERHLKRQPIFQEVHRQYSNLREGSSLAHVIGTIANSDEARQASARGVVRHESREQFARFMEVIYRRCLMRPISLAEVDIWHKNLSEGVSYTDIVLNIDNSDEARSLLESKEFSHWSAGTFVQLVFELLLKRGATPGEISHYRDRIEGGSVSRQDILAQFFLQAGRAALGPRSNAPVNDPTKADLFGRPKPVTVAQWHARTRELRDADEDRGRDAPAFTRFLFTPTAAPLVTIITSLYRGGRFIERFLENMTSQSIFRDHCELLIIDANSPENEFETASRFLKQFSNIRYKRCDTRIGIYEAWNMGVEGARGAYCTNANLDDLRRSDSFELQASALQSLSFVDVVYQDVLYSFSSDATFEDIARYGFSTSLPIVSRYNLMEFNLPHNGPMWRKSLHGEIGLFNAAYKSAGDFDFWIRCLAQGKTFYKLNDPHIAYYVNPEGLSTRTDTSGAAESDLTSQRYYRSIVSPNVTADDLAFRNEVGYEVTADPSIVTRYDVAQAALRRASVMSRRAR